MDAPKLTVPQRWELQMQKNYGPQNTYGRSHRARVQNNLVAYGLSRFVQGNRYCEITEAGRAALAEPER